MTDGVTLLLADLLNSGRPAELRKVLSVYNESAQNPAGGQLDMFSGGLTTNEEIINAINDTFKNATRREQKAMVGAAVARRKDRAEAAGAGEGTDVAGGGEGSQERRNVNQSDPTADIRQSEKISGEKEVGKPSGNDGRGDKERLGERGGSPQESSELDDNGIPFVKSSNGTTIFGEIKEDSGLTPAPIKLSEGFQDENGKGYGLAHIEAGHGSQIRNA